MGRVRARNPAKTKRARKLAAPARSKASSQGNRRHGGNLVVVGIDAACPSAGRLSTALNCKNVNPRAVGREAQLLHSCLKKVLIVGCGDFSWPLAVATCIGGSKLVATSLDDATQVQDKYGDSAMKNCKALQRCGAAVLHSIDACRLSEYGDVVAHGPFDRVVFNFPHVGGQDVQPNIELVQNFLQAAPVVLSRKGKVLIALRANSYYSSWKIETLAPQGLKFQRRAPFVASDFPGYHPQRTHPAVLRDAPQADSAFFYIYSR